MSKIERLIPTIFLGNKMLWKFRSLLKRNDLKSMVIATALVQLLFGIAWLFHVEPFRHLFRPIMDHGPLEGTEELFFFYWYSFVFSISGLITYLGRQWPKDGRRLFWIILGAWISIYFVAFYLAMGPVYTPEYYRRLGGWIFYCPPIIGFLFVATTYVIHSKMAATKELDFALDSGFRAILAFALGFVIAPVVFVGTLALFILFLSLVLRT